MAEDTKPKDEKLALNFKNTYDQQNIYTKLAAHNFNNIKKAQVFNDKIGNLKSEKEELMPDETNQRKKIEKIDKEIEKNQKALNKLGNEDFYRANLRLNYGAAYDNQVKTAYFNTITINNAEKSIARSINANITPKTGGEFKGSYQFLSKTLNTIQETKNSLTSRQDEINRRMPAIVELLLKSEMNQNDRNSLMMEQVKLKKESSENDKLLKDVTLDEKMYKNNISNLEKNFAKTISGIDEEKLTKVKEALSTKLTGQKAKLDTLKKGSGPAEELKKVIQEMETEIHAIDEKLKFKEEYKNYDTPSILANPKIKATPSPYEIHEQNKELLIKAMNKHLQNIEKQVNSNYNPSFKDFENMEKSNNIIKAYMDRNAIGKVSKAIEKVTGVNTKDVSNKIQSLFGVNVANKQERRDMQKAASMYDSLYPNEKHSNGRQVLDMMGERDGKTYKSALEVDPHELHKFKASLLRDELKENIETPKISQINDASQLALENVEEAANKVNSHDDPPSYKEAMQDTQAHEKAREIGKNAIKNPTGEGPAQTTTQTPPELTQQR